MNTLLANILKCVQSTQRVSAPSKPDIFPISSVAGLREFQHVDEEDYNKVVSRMKYFVTFYHLFIVCLHS